MITSGLGFIGFTLLLNAAVMSFAKAHPLKIFKYVPPFLVAQILAIVCNTFGVWHISDAAIKSTQSAALNYMVPLMVFLISLQCDIKKMIKIGPKMFAVFLLGSFSVCVGMCIGCAAFGSHLGIDQVPAAFGAWTAGYTGSLENLYAVSAAIGLRDENLANVILLISLSFTFWKIILIAMVSFAPKYNAWTKADTSVIDEIYEKFSAENETSEMPVSRDIYKLVGMGLCIEAIASIFGKKIGAVVPAVPSQVWVYVIITIIGVTLGSTTKMGFTNGLDLINSTLSTYVLTLTSAMVNLRSLSTAGFFFLCGATVLIIHAVIMLIGGKLMKVDLCTLGISSIANVGGVSSAPVIAAAYGRSYQAISVIMAAIGSMGGSFIGLAMINVYKLLI